MSHNRNRFRPQDELERTVWKTLRVAPKGQRRYWAQRLRTDLELRRKLLADEATFLDLYLIGWREVLKEFKRNVLVAMGAE